MTPTKTITIRGTQRERAEIGRLTAEHHYARTQFIIRSALGKPVGPTADKRLDGIEARLTRLEARRDSANRGV
jgi:hypothetical protein